MADRKDNPMLIWTEDTAELSRLLNPNEGQFTTTVRSACRKLKCSRTWFGSNIAPKVHYVYVNPVILARSRPERCYYDTNEFHQLIADSTRIEQRTKRVPIEIFIPPRRRKKYKETLIEEKLTDYNISRAALGIAENPERDEILAAVRELLRDEYEPSETLLRHLLAAAERSPSQPIPDVLGMLRKREAIMESFLDKTGKALLEAKVSPTKRSEVSWMPARPDAAAAVLYGFRKGDCGWATVASMKGWGDVDETHYRKLFEDGEVRCTIEIPKSGGGATRHVMWSKDPTPAPEPDWILDVKRPDIFPVRIDAWRRLVEDAGYKLC